MDSKIKIILSQFLTERVFIFRAVFIISTDYILKVFR